MSIRLSQARRVRIHKNLNKLPQNLNEFPPHVMSLYSDPNRRGGRSGQTGLSCSKGLSMIYKKEHSSKDLFIEFDF